MGAPADLLRPGDAARDAAACAAIYAPAVDAATSFEESPPDAMAMAERIRGAHAWVVAERGGRLTGFAYAGRYRERPAYRWTVETSVYVAADQQGRGLGRALYEALFERLEALGYRQAVAGVTVPNPASERLHQAVGFAPVGTFRSVGWKAGAWRDVRFWQRPLGPGGDGTAAPPDPYR